MADVTKNEKKPFTNNNIQNQRPGVDRSENLLTGWFANSCNGGHNKAIYFKKIMAGERIREFVLEGKFKMLTPISPSYQKLNMTISTYFVPDSRVWKNAEKYIAQRGGSTEEKIEEIPNTGGKTYGKVLSNDSSNTATLACNTTAWRDSFISSYIPRIGRSERVSASYPLFQTLPKYSILPLRGRVAIYNDFERMKSYDEEMPEYNDDTVSDAEWQSYNPFIGKTAAQYNELSDYYTMRATVPNSYFSDYRTEMQGEEISLSEAYDANEDEQLMRWVSIESKANELRQQAENENKNTWEILAEIRGSEKLSEGKVQLLSKKTITLNYSTVTQNTYNTNEDVQEQYRTMGQQGAYSYTEIKNLPLFAGVEFKEEGWIHIIINVWADTVYEKAWERTMLNVTPFSEFRPDLKDDKLDVLYSCESGMPYATTGTSDETNIYYKATGFKRLYSEYFKMGNYCGGDMLSDPYYQSFYTGEMDTLDQTQTNFNTVETQRTHQFFRGEAKYIETGIEKGMPIAQTKIWKDYSDILINRNQANLNDTTAYKENEVQYKSPEIQGQNQIFFIGKCYCRTELPIPEEIKNNYTKYGEH